MPESTIANAEQVTIKGIVYDVLDSQTPDQERANGHPNIARAMDKNRHARSLILRRPSGSLAFCATQFLSGNYSTPRSLGHWGRGL